MQAAMRYGDFSSLVQLGVGLHVGTAILQLYGDIGVQPLVRTISRTRSLFTVPEQERPPKELEDELDRLESRYEIFRIRLFKEYRRYVLANSIVALLLAILLAVLAFKADDLITGGWESLPPFFVFFSLCPALITLGALWLDANRQVKPMKTEADALEKKALASSK
jgi:hypothetical protein